MIKIILKKIVLVMITVFLAVMITSSAPMKKPVSIVVLAYHNILIENNTQSGSNISYSKFAKDLEQLKDQGYISVSFKEISQYLEGEGTLPQRPVLITFDDGYISNYELAYPLLKKMNMKASIAVIGWSVGQNRCPATEKEIIPHFSWNEAREMSCSGVIELFSHTYDLHSKPGKSMGMGVPCGNGVLGMYGETPQALLYRLSEDFYRSNREIEENIGASPMVLSFPFSAYSANSDRLSRTIYKGTLTMKPGVRSYWQVEDLYLMPRIGVKENTDVVKEIKTYLRAENNTLEAWVPKGLGLLYIVQILVYFLWETTYLVFIRNKVRKVKWY